MKFTALCCIAALSFATQAAAAESITAHSAVMDSFVNVNVIEVEQTPMSNQNFCTLMTGTFCSPASVDWQAVPNMLLPTLPETSTSE